MARVPYGIGPYSRISAFAPTFSGALDLPANLVGNLAPAVIFGPATLTTPQNIAGDLAPIVAFAASLSVTYAIAGNLAPQTALGASLSGDWVLAGNMIPSVGFAVSVEAGPLWAASQPCPSPEWGEGESCPPAMWTPMPPPQWQIDGSVGSYGLGPYGVGPYNSQSVTPWREMEKCDGG